MTITIVLTKVCSRCKIEKDITEYHKRPDRPDGIVSHCKQCEKERKSKMAKEVKAYSKKYYEEHKEEVCLRSKLKAKEKREYIQKIKSNTPCKDCGQKFHFAQMDFDHRDDTNKDFNLSGGDWQTYETIDAEIAKCDIVCSNCHRLRTYNRKQYNVANKKSWQVKKESAEEKSSAPSVSDILADMTD